MCSRCAWRYLSSRVRYFVLYLRYQRRAGITNVVTLTIIIIIIILDVDNAEHVLFPWRYCARSRMRGFVVLVAVTCSASLRRFLHLPIHINLQFTFTNRTERNGNLNVFMNEILSIRIGPNEILFNIELS